MAVDPEVGCGRATRSRGRRPTFDREEALATALDLFWRHGYEGVSIADLTKAIGIAAPSLYHAFGGKADLYREALRRYASVGLGPDDIGRAASGRDAARAMLEHGIAAVTKPGGPSGCMVSSGLLMTSTDNADLAAELARMRAASRAALERRIRRDVEDGALPGATDPVALARFVVAVLQGISVQALDGADAADLLPIVAHVLDTWPHLSRSGHR